MKKNRGILLTILIILIGLSYVNGLANSSQYRTVHIVLSLLGLISLIGVWMWKKWGLFLQIGVYAVSFGITLFLLQSPKVSKDLDHAYFPFVIWMIVFGAIPVVLGFIALKKRWKYFE